MRWNTNSIVNTTGKLFVTRRLSKRTNNECITLDNKPKPLPLINNTSMNAEEIDEEIRQEMLNYQNKNLLVDIDDKKKINKTRTVGRVKCDKCPMFVSRKNISVHYRLYHATACQKLKEDIFPTMREDDIFDIIKYDTILILYLNEICEQYDVKDQNNLIKNHARALGRFISVMRKIDYETEFNSHWLTMIGSKIVSSQNLMKKKNEGKTIGEMSSNDVNLLIEFLDQRRIILFEKIKETLTKKLYNDLIATQMIYVQCSNGRRPGETARKLLSDYTTRMTHDTNNEFFKMLDPEEKERTIKYSVMDTKGKKLHILTGRVYLRAQDEMILDFLITQRNSVNILSTNEYLYAPAPEHSDKNVLHIDAHIAMKKLVDYCEETYKKFENRSTVTATGFRKFIATSYKNRTKGQYSKELMRHLAHDENTHDKAYRKVTAQETAKITAILENIIIDAGKNKEQRISQIRNQNQECSSSTLTPTREESVEVNIETHDQEKETETVQEKLTLKKRRSWKRDDICDFENAFANEISDGVYPTRKKIREMMIKYPKLQKRGEGAIRAKFQNLKKRILL
ncbi:hypothetical protein TKK_0000208 [Trichogramma kaykai]